MRIIFLLFASIVLTSCTVVPPDNFVTQRLTALSGETDKHFEHLINTFGTKECEFSSAPNQKYWSATTSALNVLEVRVSAFPQNQDLSEGFLALSDTLKSLRSLEMEAASQSTGVRCLEHDVEIANLWPPISTSFTDLIAASSTNIVR